MSRRARFWWVMAVLSILVNLGGALYAVRMAEPIHAAVHVMAFVATLILVRQFTTRRDATSREQAARRAG